MRTLNGGEAKKTNGGAIDFGSIGSIIDTITTGIGSTVNGTGATNTSGAGTTTGASVLSGIASIFGSKGAGKQ